MVYLLLAQIRLEFSLAAPEIVTAQNMSADKRRRARVQGGWAAPAKNVRSDMHRPKAGPEPAWLARNVDQPTTQKKFVYEQPDEVCNTLSLSQLKCVTEPLSLSQRPPPHHPPPPLQAHTRTDDDWSQDRRLISNNTEKHLVSAAFRCCGGGGCFGFIFYILQELSMGELECARGWYYNYVRQIDLCVCVCVWQCVCVCTSACTSCVILL